MRITSLFTVTHASRPANATFEMGNDARARMPSVLDLDIEYEDSPKPRGASVETWHRARGWSSED